MKSPFAEFRRLISMPLLDELAVEYDVNAKNHVRLPGQAVFLCLLNGLLNHVELSLRMLEDQYKKLTRESCDHSSFGKRLATLDPAYFRAILDHLYSRISPSLSDARALRLRIVDATIVTLSAKLLDFGLKANHGGKGVKRQIKSVIEISDEGLPNLLHICSDQSEFSDAVALGHTMKDNSHKGDLWVFDKGCHGREALFSLHKAGSFWITPHSNQGLKVIETLYETSPDLPEVPEKNEPIVVIHRADLVIFANKWDRIADLESMHMVIIRCHRWDTRSRRWRPFELMTNLPLGECRSTAGPYSFPEVAELYRRRWEIETFFKLIKQHLGYDHLISRSENGIRIMILMSVITALLMIWYRQAAHIQGSWKSVKFWFAEGIRSWTVSSIRAMTVRQT